MNKEKILFNADVFHNIRDTKSPISNTLKNIFRNEISDFKLKHPNANKITPFDICMFQHEIDNSMNFGEIMNRISIAGDENEFLIPVYISSTLEEITERNNVLQYVLAQTKTEASSAIKTYTYDPNDPKNKEAGRLVRVSEGADLPLARLILGSRAISLYKQGRAVEITYEAFKKMTIDEMALTLTAISRDIGKQNLYGISDVAINGDGNNNPAINLGTVATAGTITAKELRGFLYEFFLLEQTGATTIICNAAVAEQISAFVYSTNETSGVGFGFSIETPQMDMKNLKLIMVDDMPMIDGKDVIGIMNASEGIIKHIEAGSQINEAATMIRNQTKLSTVSEVSGFSKFNKNSIAYVSMGKAVTRSAERMYTGYVPNDDGTGTTEKKTK